jgi:hypothetical protein
MDFFNSLLGVVGALVQRPDYTINGSLKAGVSLYLNNDYSFRLRFTEAPSGGPDFVTTTELDDAVANLTAALELQTTAGASFKVGYTGSFGSVSRSNGGHLRAIVPF